MTHLMPKASAVADLPHHRVPAPGDRADEGASCALSALDCPHTGAPCPALSALFSSLTPAGDDARAWIQKLAPCGQCRVAFEGSRNTLRHVRLGQRERDVLIGVSGGGVFTVTEPGMSRSLSAARRRAALSLVKAGLVVAAVAPRPAAEVAQTPQPARAAVSLTPLGHYVLAAYGRFIKAGKPVRWTRPSRRVPLPGRDPSLLVDDVLARTTAALRETLEDLKGVLIAAVARPMKDPSLLESVTRHLEYKASVLRAVLEPSMVQSGAQSGGLAGRLR